MSRDELVDPDPWIVASLVVATAAMIGQYAQIAIDWNVRRKADRLLPPLRTVKAHLRDGLENSISDVEKIIRLLPRLEGCEIDPLVRPFSYGQTSLYMTKLALHEYSAKVEVLAIGLGHLNKLSTALIADDPELAAQIGSEITASFGRIDAKINGFYRDAPPIGDVLSDCLAILRECERILVRIENSN
ncbi:hypothetical protein [Devosia marina]|uniref:Uncharacterized protein n=1 Tax=Devosia marina TaxID=2683198 RepID=A0A7X3K2H6_9HYPH|nr:hypothetical protein [Devosia marina]MVS97880.1 hypothetical protein [Devosia marina]